MISSSIFHRKEQTSSSRSRHHHSKKPRKQGTGTSEPKKTYSTHMIFLSSILYIIFYIDMTPNVNLKDEDVPEWIKTQAASLAEKTPNDRKDGNNKKILIKTKPTANPEEKRTNSHNSKRRNGKRNDRNTRENNDTNRNRLGLISVKAIPDMDNLAPNNFILTDENMKESLPRLLRWYQHIKQFEQEQDQNNATIPAGISTTRSILFQSFQFIIQRYGEIAKENEILEKLCSLVINGILFTISIKPNPTIIINLFNEGTSVFSTLLQSLSSSPAPLVARHPLLLLIQNEPIKQDYQRYAVQYLYIQLAKLLWIKELYTNPNAPNYTLASTYLHVSTPLNPLQPLCRYSLGELAEIKGSLFDSIYNYMMCIDTGAGIEGREKIGFMYERARQELVTLENMKKKSRGPLDIPNLSLRLTCLRVLNCTGVLFTKIGIDNFALVLDKINCCLLDLLKKVMTHDINLSASILPRIVCLSLISVFNSIYPLGPEMKHDHVVINKIYSSPSFSVTSPPALSLLLHIIRVIARVYVDYPTESRSLLLPPLVLWSLYIYTYPSMLDCPDIPLKSILSALAPMLRNIPAGEEVEFIYKHTNIECKPLDENDEYENTIPGLTNERMNKDRMKNNDINTRDNCSVDISNEEYINSIKNSIPPEITELIGVHAFYPMILNSLPATPCSIDSLRTAIISRSKSLFVARSLMEIRGDGKIYAINESYYLQEEEEEEEDQDRIEFQQDTNNRGYMEHEDNSSSFGNRNNNIYRNIDTSTIDDEEEEDSRGKMNSSYMNTSFNKTINRDSLMKSPQKGVNNRENTTVASEFIIASSGNNNAVNEVDLDALLSLGNTDDNKKGLIKINAQDLPKPANPYNSKSLSRYEYQQIKSLKDTDYKPLIVIDAPNVCMRHGTLSNIFSSQGLKIALNYYRSRGHKVISFIPDYYLDAKRVAEKARLVQLGFKREDGKKYQASIPDNLQLLRSLRDKGMLITTPSQDYDDSYCIRYAQNHDGCIVSNDLYRDYIDSLPINKKNILRKWIRTHVISYTFIENEFLPNPNFVFPEPSELVDEQELLSDDEEIASNQRKEETQISNSPPVNINNTQNTIPQEVPKEQIVPENVTNVVSNTSESRGFNASRFRRTEKVDWNDVDDEDSVTSDDKNTISENDEYSDSDSNDEYDDFTDNSDQYSESDEDNRGNEDMNNKEDLS
ncbi:hypothetical protein WA158_006073 [Blastocystis sp. Blastoise]